VGGAFVLSLRNFGVLPTNLLTENGVIIGSLLEGAILAVGLGQKMNRLSLERERAQAQTIAALQENERLIVEQNLTLEQKVRERTDELKRANEELNSTNEELHATLEHVTHQNKIIERKNADILESIRYALRIQTAILPEDEFIRQTVPDFFVFYRPKDVVSGDFYWFGYLEKDDAVAMAVVDCTGHGVPGAFMSVVGYNQLNRAVLEMRLTDPAEILTELDVRIRQTLKQDVGSDRFDGMDLALCVWLRKENRLLFAGAQRPLYYFDSAGAFFSVSGDKFPVGGAQARDKRFTTHEILLSGRQSFYLFSDGFTDQFGGPNRRKFTPKRLQELLSQIRGLDFSEQGIRMQTAFDDWKGIIEQLDDVSVFGFSLAERR
jgi:serine phosphatase RsbU (regulator of sigma subunit)